MQTTTQARIQMFGAWCGVLYVLGLIIGWGLIAGFILPLHRPSAGAEEITAIFQTHTTRIRIGMIIVMFTAMIAIPFCALVSQFLTRVEGKPGMLTYSALLAGAGTVVLTFYPAIFWLIAAYRPERAPDIIQTLNDLGWLQDIGGVTLYFPLPASIAIAAFCDSSANPVFPRWAGFVNLWVILLIVPDQLMFFFHAGPFAWNGLFGFWLPLVAFGGWFFLTSHLLRNAIRSDLAAAVTHTRVFSAA